jgi:hypothetical protein
LYLRGDRLPCERIADRVFVEGIPLVRFLISISLSNWIRTMVMGGLRLAESGRIGPLRLLVVHFPD